MSYVTEEFVAMASINSPPTQEGEFAGYLVERLTQLGCSVVTDGSAAATGSDVGNLIARFPGRGRGIEAPVLLLSAHMDTVAPTEGMVPQIKDGRFVSNGETVLGADDKAGIALILAVLERLQKDETLPCPSLEIVLTVQEEVGLTGCRALTEPLKAAYGYVLDCDGDVGTLVNQAPTHTIIELVVQGRAAHAGIEPEKGVSAIVAAAEAIAQTRSGRIDLETTSNFGMIHGGAALNVVAERVDVAVEVRSLNPERMEEEAGHIIEVFSRVCEAKGAKLSVSQAVQYQAFHLDDNHPLVCLARGAAEAAGLDFVVEATGGGSDANIYNERGVPCAVLGIGMKEAHTVMESVAVEQLENGVGFLTEIVLGAARINP
ncbi:MAG: M20/M25/M40 family metallo-hydrolase [Peptococcaceae bacterium]|nr:M20/M25/M40 family metallo-hydrolase [Peptococcaceae bacterium]